MRRRRGLVVGAAAVALALIAGTVTTGIMAVRARRAGEEAARQARTTAAVNGFLTRMLGAANPESNPRGLDMTVREVVDQAAAALPERSGLEPEVEAGIRRTLGTTYMGLGLYPEAETQLRQALAARPAAGVTPRRRTAWSRWIPSSRRRARWIPACAPATTTCGAAISAT